MNTRKIVSLLLSLIMAMSMVGGAFAEEATTLTVAWWGSQARNDLFTAAFDAYTAANPGVAFEMQINSFGDHMTALSAAAASDTMPDMSMSQSDYLKPYVDAGKLLDLTPYIESGALDLSNVSESVISTGVVNGGIYGISAGSNAVSLIYNKTLLEENGIEIKNLMTYDDFVSIAREVYEKTGVKTQIDNASSWLELLARADGKHFYGEGKLGFDTYEEMLPFFNLVETGHKEGWLIDQAIVVATGGALEEQALVKYSSPETQSWCSLFFSNQMVALQGAAPEGVVLDLVTLPSSNPAASNYVRQAMCWTISANSEHIDETIAVLNWWINSEEANGIVLGEPGVPANSVIANSVAAKLNETTATTFKYVIDTVIPNSSPCDPLAPAGAAQIRESVVVEAFEKVAYGVASAEEAAQEVFDLANSVLANAL